MLATQILLSQMHTIGHFTQSLGFPEQEYKSQDFHSDNQLGDNDKENYACL